MSHLLLSFRSGIVRPMLGTVARPSQTFGKFSEEAVYRCANMAEGGSVIEKETLKVIGTVEYDGNNFVYKAAEATS